MTPAVHQLEDTETPVASRPNLTIAGAPNSVAIVTEEIPSKIARMLNKVDEKIDTKYNSTIMNAREACKKIAGLFTDADDRFIEIITGTIAKRKQAAQPHITNGIRQDLTEIMYPFPLDRSDIDALSGWPGWPEYMLEEINAEFTQITGDQKIEYLKVNAAKFNSKTREQIEYINFRITITDAMKNRIIERMAQSE